MRTRKRKAVKKEAVARMGKRGGMRKEVLADRDYVTDFV